MLVDVMSCDVVAGVRGRCTGRSWWCQVKIGCPRTPQSREPRALCCTRRLSRTDTLGHTWITATRKSFVWNLLAPGRHRAFRRSARGDESEEGCVLMGSGNLRSRGSLCILFLSHVFKLECPTRLAPCVLHRIRSAFQLAMPLIGSEDEITSVHDAGEGDAMD